MNSKSLLSWITRVLLAAVVLVLSAMILVALWSSTKMILASDQEHFDSCCTANAAESNSSINTNTNDSNGSNHGSDSDKSVSIKYRNKTLERSVQVLEVPCRKSGKPKTCMLSDGTVKGCVSDSRTGCMDCEVMVHFACRYIPPDAPSTVLVIASGTTPLILQEIEKYKTVKHIVCIELDEQASKACQEHMCVKNVENFENLKNPVKQERIKKEVIPASDAIQTIDKLSLVKDSHRKFDLILLDLDLDLTFEFVQNLHVILAQNGVVAMKSQVNDKLTGHKLFVDEFGSNGVLEYGTYNPLTERYAWFLLAGDANLKNAKIDMASWNGRGVGDANLQHYDPSKHFEYVPWIALDTEDTAYDVV